MMDRDKLKAMAESVIIAGRMSDQEYRVRVWALVKYIMEEE